MKTPPQRSSELLHTRAASCCEHLRIGDHPGTGSVTVTRAFMGSNRTQKPTCLLAEPLVSDRVAVLHKNALHTSGRSCGEQSSRSTGREARRLRSADRTRRRISTPAGPPQRELCPALAFSLAGETLPSYLTDESGSRPKSRDANRWASSGQALGHRLQVRTRDSAYISAST